MDKDAAKPYSFKIFNLLFFAIIFHKRVSDSTV